MYCGIFEFGVLNRAGFCGILNGGCCCCNCCIGGVCTNGGLCSCCCVTGGNCDDGGTFVLFISFGSIDDGVLCGA